jgi:tetratricopeptide (TPR) repeat protein
VVQLCYRINLSTGYFYSGRYEQAMACYDASENIFEKYRNDKIYGGYIAELDILAAIQSGQYEQAAALLDAAAQEWREPRLQEAFGVIRQTLDQLQE